MPVVIRMEVNTYREFLLDSLFSRAQTRRRSWFRTWDTDCLHKRSSNPGRIRPPERKIGRYTRQESYWCPSNRETDKIISPLKFVICAKSLTCIIIYSNHTAKQEWKECDSQTNVCHQRKTDGQGHYLATGGGSCILSAYQINFYLLFLPCHKQ
jgi:hypothetical protein